MAIRKHGERFLLKRTSSRRSSVRSLMALAVLLSGGLTLFDSPVHIQANAYNEGITGACFGEQYAHYWVGYLGYSRSPASWNESPEGVSGYLQVRPGYMCPDYGYDNNGQSSAWFMLQSQGSQTEYAQAGFTNVYGCITSFTEWAHAGYDQRKTGRDCLPIGGVYTVSVTYTGPRGPNPTCNCGNLLLSGPDNLDETTFDPWIAGWRMSPAFQGETVYVNNEMPGSNTSPTGMTSLGIQSVDTSALRQIPCYLNKWAPDGSANFPYNPPQYYANATACDNISVWNYPAP